MARKQFFALDKQLIKEPIIAYQYRSFMPEYLVLGHMEPVDVSYKGSPFNALADSTIIKLEVISDSSAVTSSRML